MRTSATITTRRLLPNDELFGEVKKILFEQYKLCVRIKGDSLLNDSGWKADLPHHYHILREKDEMLLGTIYEFEPGEVFLGIVKPTGFWFGYRIRTDEDGMYIGVCPDMLARATIKHRVVSWKDMLGTGFGRNWVWRLQNATHSMQRIAVMKGRLPESIVAENKYIGPGWSNENSMRDM